MIFAKKGNDKELEQTAVFICGIISVFTCGFVEFIMWVNIF